MIEVNERSDNDLQDDLQNAVELVRRAQTIQRSIAGVVDAEAAAKLMVEVKTALEGRRVVDVYYGLAGLLSAIVLDHPYDPRGALTAIYGIADGLLAVGLRKRGKQ